MDIGPLTQIGIATIIILTIACLVLIVKIHILKRKQKRQEGDTTEAYKTSKDTKTKRADTKQEPKRSWFKRKDKRAKEEHIEW